MKASLLCNVILAISFTCYAQFPGDTLVNLNISWPVTTLPIENSIKQLCKTDSGRILIKENMDSIKKIDLFFQWEGLKMNKEPVPPTFEQYLVQKVNEMCSTNNPGYIFLFPSNSGYFYYTKGPGLPDTLLDYIHCWSANKNGKSNYDCNFEADLKLPDGWQACRIMYKAKKVRHGKYTVTPSFFTSDVGEFPRFKAYKVRITGHGDAGNPSAVYLTEVRIFALSEYATLEDRRKCGCDLPNRTSTAHQPVIQQPSPSIPSASPAKITAHIINRKPGGCQVLIQNTGGTAGRIYFQIWRYDHDYKKRVMAFDTGPNFLVPANYVVPIFPLFQYNTSDYQFLSPPIMH